MLSPETLRAAAELARRRAAEASDPRIRVRDQEDGLERLGAARALLQLAIDLEDAAVHEERGQTHHETWKAGSAPK